MLQDEWLGMVLSLAFPRGFLHVHVGLNLGKEEQRHVLGLALPASSKESFFLALFFLEPVTILVIWDAMEV